MHLLGRSLGRYRLISVLGSGGMAVVYRAFDPKRERHVALKVLTPSGNDDGTSSRRFAREGQIIAKLRHPHILPVYEYAEEGDERFIAMPLAEGGTLADQCAQGPSSVSMLLRWIREIADALDYAHARGIVHRDLKPGNVLLDEHGACKLTDFGIAKLSWSSARLTRTGAVFGTPLYMSPEQAMGEDTDHRSDVYSLGVLAYELLTGDLPFVAETPAAIGYKHVCAPVPPARDRNPGLPRAVESTLRRALAKRPHKRFATAGDFAASLVADFRHRAGASTTRLAERETMLPASELRARIRTRRVRALSGVISSGVATLALVAALAIAVGSERVAGAHLVEDPVEEAEQLAVSKVQPGVEINAAALELDRAKALTLVRRDELRDAGLARSVAALARGRTEDARNAVLEVLDWVPDDEYARQRLAVLDRRIAAERSAREAAARAPDPRIVAAQRRADEMQREAEEAREEVIAERAAREAAEAQAEEQQELLLARLEAIEASKVGRSVTGGSSAGGPAPTGPAPRPAGPSRGGGGGRGR